MLKFTLKRGRDMFETHVEDLARKHTTLIANCYALVNFKKLCAPLKALFICENRGHKGSHVELGFATLATVDGEFERPGIGAVFT